MSDKRRLEQVNRRLRDEIATRTAMEQRFRGLLESAPDAIIIVNSEGLIDLVNTQAENWFGYAREELLGMPVDRLVPDRFRAAHGIHRKSYMDSPTARPMGEAIELYAVRKDGSEFPVEISLSPMRTEQGLLVISIIRDVTARKRIEQARRQDEYRIRQLNEVLQARQTELETINHELDAFSYSVSHDLRAPLRAMDGFSHALLSEYGDKLDDRGRDRLVRVRNAAQRMATLIDDLLKLSRVSRSQLSLEAIDLGRIAAEVMEALRQSDPQRVVEFSAPAGLVTHGDPHLMRVAMNNLLGNAWKFTGRKPRARIELGGAVNASEHIYFVRDNGAGFDMRYADKLFGAFQRLHDAGEFPGNGIGLATVQRVIHKHGGRIWAEGEIDRGATFYFTLNGKGA